MNTLPIQRVLQARRNPLSVLPTLLVVVTLGALGYLGHHFGWNVPKFSELVHGDVDTGPAWCDEHSVPEADCISCNADLLPKGKLFGWCAEHGVRECVLDHPELAQLAEPPGMLQSDLDRARRALSLRPRPQNDPACKLSLRRIQFASIKAAKKAGIDIRLVERGPLVETISATGEVIYDPTRVARLASRAAGTAWRVDKNVGDRVQPGDVLALIDAASVGRAKAELLQAVAQYRLAQQTIERLQGLQGVVAGKRMLEAEAASNLAEASVRKSIQELQNLGLPIVVQDAFRKSEAELAVQLRYLGLPPDVAKQVEGAATANLVPIVAPRAGIVVRRNVVAGEVVDPSRMLFTVADTTRMWLVLDVPLEQAKYLSLGQKVLFRSDASDHTDVGTLTWISTDVDVETRTVRARAELNNEDRHLRNEVFGAGEIVLREEEDAILVPSSAVHWEGCCFVVFVRDKNWFKGRYKVIHTRSIRPGIAVGDKTEVIAGLLPGEVVVTQGSGVLSAELLKGNLGAG